MRPRLVDHPTVRADWARRGYSCELWIDPPDRVWHDFQHETDLLLLLLEGAIRIELPDRTIRLEVGDEVGIPAHTRFTIRHAGEQPARWLHGYREGQAAAG
ncbi:MAG: cupin domain-containing protein [Planctomycetes bacterium]|nr:cupin domain-containing protein [Planctomycetota bacterium]